MTRYLFTTLPTNDLGLLTRSLPIAGELSKRGHEIAFCSPAQAPSKVIAEAGFQNLIPKHPLYVLMAAEPTLRGLGRALRSGWREWGFLSFVRHLARSAPTRLARSTAEVWSADHLAALSGMLNANFVHANCDALMALVGEYRPDVVVDFWNPFACITARAVQMPLVTVIQADMHPGNRGFIWWREPPSAPPTVVPTLNRVLTEYGLPPVNKMEELFLGDLTLVLGMPDTDPLPEGADATYIGPILWQKPGAGPPGWLDEPTGKEPVVWVYSGNPRYLPVRSPVDSAVVLQASIKALEDEKLQVILSTGHHPLPEEVLPLPANFRHEAYVPGLAMASRSELLIHHGGYGSCQTGLYTGTPAVIVPTYSERESNARRVAAVGAGEIVLPREGVRAKKEVPADELRAKVRQVLVDPAYRANAIRIREKLKSYGGAGRAARLIEGLGQG